VFTIVYSKFLIDPYLILHKKMYEYICKIRLLFPLSIFMEITQFRPSRFSNRQSKFSVYY